LSRDPRLTVATRELASLRSEKTIVLALAIQLFIAAFSSFLVVGLVTMYDPGSVEGYGLDLGVAGDAADEFVPVAAEEPDVDATTYPSEAAAMQAFQDRRVDAVVVTDRLADDRIRASVTAPEGSFETTVTVVTLRQVLQRFETDLREQRSRWLDRRPVPVPDRVGSSPYFGFTYTVLVPLLLFLPVFIGGSIAVDSLAEEIERGTLELLRVSPATPVEVLEGKLLAAAGPVPLQAALWIALLRFDGTGVARVPELLTYVAALATTVSAVGLALAALAADRRLAQFLYSAGILVVFAATLLLPESPANTVARLAIGSPGPGTYVSLAGAVLLAVLSVVGLRLAARRADGR
jgi:ABC-type Na+ efflux pump permease subunit